MKKLPISKLFKEWYKGLINNDMKKDYKQTAIWKYYLKVEEKHFKQQQIFDGDYPKMNKYEEEYFEACQMAEEIKKAYV